MKIHCPYCKTITTWEENPYRPFCSERCKIADLGMWASEKYQIEGEYIADRVRSEKENNHD